jgi:tetratricopeptide (TPR) repeat protein
MVSSLANESRRPGPDVDPQNPWPGLHAYAEAFSQYFCGRDEEAEELLRRVRRKLLTVLFGQSGLGKTSLLQAGLFPRLRREGFLPVPIRLVYASDAAGPAAQVRAVLAEALAAAAGPGAPPRPAAGTLWEQLHRLGGEAKAADGRPLRPILVFDQFEELFTRGCEPGETRQRTEAFLTELADLVENRPPASLERQFEQRPGLVEDFVFDRQDYRVLLSLREDYLPHLEGLRERMPSLAQNRMRLTRMTGRQALLAVTGPGGSLVAADAGPEVVRFVAAGQRDGPAGNGQAAEDDLEGLEVDPFLLSLVCRELNNERRARNLPQITADLLAVHGRDILQRFYERCLEGQPPGVRAFIEDRLLDPSGSSRESLSLPGARADLAARGAPPSALDELVERRLLQVEERLKVQRVELAHDVLTPVVRKGREDRRRDEAEEGRLREAREKVRRYRRRWQLTAFGLVLCGAVVAGLVALVLVANAARKEARDAEHKAVEARTRQVFSEQALTAFLKAYPSRSEKDPRKYGKPLAELAELEKLFPTGEDYWLSYRSVLLDGLGRAYTEARDFTRAEAAFKDALRVDKDRAASRPKDLQRQTNLAISYSRLTSALFAQERLKEALAYQELANTQNKKIVEDLHDEKTKTYLANGQARRQEIEQAIKLMKGAVPEVTILGFVSAVDPPDLVRVNVRSRTYPVAMKAGKRYEIVLESLGGPAGTRKPAVFLRVDGDGKGAGRGRPPRLLGTAWDGREDLANYGPLRFEFGKGGTVVMTDKLRTTPGTYTRRDSHVVLWFASVCYDGAVSGNGETLAGSASVQPFLDVTAVALATSPVGEGPLLAASALSPGRAGSWNFSVDLTTVRMTYPCTRDGVHRITVGIPTTSGGGEYRLRVAADSRAGTR